MSSSDLVAIIVTTIVFGSIYGLVSIGMPLMGRRAEIDFEMVTFITTFAVAIVFANLALQIFGPFQKNVPPIIAGGISILGVHLDYHSILMALTSILLMVGLGLFLSRTRWGFAILGGLGSLKGTLYAAYIIGFIQALAIVLVGTTWSLPILYGVILLVLVF